MTSLEEFYCELKEYLDVSIPDVNTTIRSAIATHIIHKVAERDREVLEEFANQLCGRSRKGEQK